VETRRASVLPGSDRNLPSLGRDAVRPSALRQRRRRLVSVRGGQPGDIRKQTADALDLMKALLEARRRRPWRISSRSSRPGRFRSQLGTDERGLHHKGAGAASGPILFRLHGFGTPGQLVADRRDRLCRVADAAGSAATLQLPSEVLEEVHHEHDRLRARVFRSNHDGAVAIGGRIRPRWPGGMRSQT
jgi:hypothetical protein